MTRCRARLERRRGHGTPDFWAFRATPRACQGARMRPTAADIALGELLRARRGALDPAEVGVATYGRRRVPGLRREEVAFLAGVSASYYTRIEQGTAGAVSAGVLGAIADALRLGPEDRAQLNRLADVAPARERSAPAEVVLPSLAALLPHLEHLPVGVLGRSMRLLAWNRCAQAVFTPHRGFDAPGSAPGLNWAEILVLDPECRSLFIDWPLVVEDLVGRLRVTAARHPGDREVAAVVESLSAASAFFAASWARHPAREGPLGGTRLDHPVLGILELEDTVLRSSEDEDQVMVVFRPAIGSPTERALRHWAATSVPHRDLRHLRDGADCS